MHSKYITRTKAIFLKKQLNIKIIMYFNVHFLNSLFLNTIYLENNVLQRTLVN